MGSQVPMSKARKQRDILPAATTSKKKGRDDPNDPSPPDRHPLLQNGLSARPVRTRTSHACDRCRDMRAKCSGGATCDKCTKDGVECLYSDRRRERNKKELAESVDRIGELENDNHLLVEAVRKFLASPSLRGESSAEVADVLARYAAATKSSSSSMYGDSDAPDSMDIDSSHTPTVSAAPLGETMVPSTVGSPGHFGEITRIVDLDSGTGVSGFVGKMSEMSWIERVRKYVSQSKSPQHDSFDNNPTGGDFGHNDFGYFADDADVLAVDEDGIDETQWPPGNLVWILTEAFFHSCQGAFELVERDEFLNKVATYPQEKRVPSWAERRWLATANLIWALGARWLELIHLEHQGQESHLTYYARSRALGLDHRILFDHPDLDRISAVGLLALYLLVNGMITRSWTILGHAIRHATAMGLHLRLIDPSVSFFEEQRRSRTWYSLYSLEVLLTELTGRPKCISLADVSPTMLDMSRPAPDEPMVIDPSYTESMWLDFLNQNSRGFAQAQTGRLEPWSASSTVNASGLDGHFAHFMCRAQLCQISDIISERLYRPGIDLQPWSETQLSIDKIQTDLTVWLDQLPSELDIASDTSATTDPRDKIELAMYYHSVQMILYRPCLCEIQIDNESSRSKEFNLSCGRACVEAAKNLISIMPENLSAKDIFQLFPWWSLLHYLCQATSVLLLELCMDCVHFRSEEMEVVRALRQSMAHLYCLTESSASAYKAWRILRRLLADVAEKSDYPAVDNMPVNAPAPSTWTDRDEAILMGSSAVFPR